MYIIGFMDGLGDLLSEYMTAFSPSAFQSFKDLAEYWHLFTYLDPFKISCIFSDTE